MNSIDILLAHFDRLAEKSLYEMLCRSGHKVRISSSHDETLSCISEKAYPVILADLNGSDELSIFKTIKERSQDSEIIVVASYGSLENAVSAIKLGAFDYLVRPVKDERILSSIKRALTERNAKTIAEKIAPQENIIHQKRLSRKSDFYGLIGKGDKQEAINSVVKRIAGTKTTILIQGESGTGKRLIAHAIHSADKKRKDKPFVELSCGALPREIIESELFGHTKGSFTGAINDRKGRFELANGGTILLDDIDSLPLDLQVKLLRIIQEKEFERVGDHKTIKVDVRVITTTNQDIKKAMQEKRFREDLYYRINVLSITVPPLRDRKEDLSGLIDHFLKKYSKENHKTIRGISEKALNALKAYHWPGNIRELENIIERAIILDIDKVVDTDDLPEVIMHEKMGPEIFKNIARTLKDVLHEPEKVHILQVLKEVGWNKKRAARKLGVNRTTLYNKLRKYKIVTEVD